MAFSTSNEEAYSPPISPNAAKALPIALVSAFSIAEVVLITPWPLISSAYPVEMILLLSSSIEAFIITLCSSSVIISVRIEWVGKYFLNIPTLLATVAYSLPLILTLSIFVSYSIAFIKLLIIYLQNTNLFKEFWIIESFSLWEINLLI